MFKKKNDRPLTEFDMQNLLDKIAEVMGAVLTLKQRVFEQLKPHDLLITCLPTDDGYIEGYVYQQSKCRFTNGRPTDFPQPLYLFKRNLNDKQDVEEFIDENAVDYLSESTIQALMMVRALVMNYHLRPTLSEKDEEEIKESLKLCLGNTQMTGNMNSAKLSSLDTVIMTSMEETGISTFLFKLSECNFIYDTPVELSSPFYVGTLNFREGLQSNASPDVANTIYQSILEYVNWCLGTVVKTR
ncbi:hypothetical protein [Bacillus sp. EB01]|uniref:hypothetical protein n=1 Tax=Bacillus sp. EB01 TaxID=1347086 RepID=UPI0005C490F6|nr:hypothetical protein [Bacillus sp. EB01]